MIAKKVSTDNSNDTYLQSPRKSLLNGAPCKASSPQYPLENAALISGFDQRITNDSIEQQQQSSNTSIVPAKTPNQNLLLFI